MTKQLRLAPLIDVVFLLLVFFILSTHFDHETTMILDLPAKTSTNASPNDMITIVIEANDLKFNSQPVQLNELRNKLNMAPQTIQIQFHESILWQSLAEVLVEIQAAGDHRLKFKKIIGNTHADSA